MSLEKISALGIALGDPNQVKPNTLNLVRSVEGLARPKNKQELSSLVKLANQEGLKLYPISRGRNWGLGSALPAEDSCVVVDLSLMNKISEYDPVLGTVRIEPGVTQAQLSEFLYQQGSSFMLDVTGSSRDSSVLGNALERGISYFRQRVDYVLAMEIITGSGEQLQTGFQGFQNCSTKSLYKFGVGPGFDGLFFQSSFGIVTSMCIQLIRKLNTDEAFVLSFADSELESAIESLRELTRDGYIFGITHLANKERSKSSVTPKIQEILTELGSTQDVEELFEKRAPYEWSCVGIVGRSKTPIRRSLRKLRKKRLLFINHQRLQVGKMLTKLLGLKGDLAFLLVLEELRKFLSGIPSDIATQSFAPDANSVDRSDLGMAYLLPVAPLTGQHARQMLSHILRATQDLKPAVTLNILNARVLEAVVSYHFEKSNSEAIRKRVLEASQGLKRAGYQPYRLSLWEMQEFMSAHPLADWIAKLKKVFDPNGVIAPGRYS